MKNLLMAAFAVLFWLTLLPGFAHFALPRLMPIDNVYELRQVIVRDFVIDATPENSPHMTVDRSILADFEGFFRVDTRRVDGSRFEPVNNCSVGHSEERAYRRGATLPEVLTLNWWINEKVQPPCTRVPGQYIVNTQVCRVLPIGAESCTPWVSSNPFWIREAK